VTFLTGAYQASSYLFAFVVMLGVLIFVHELGHFLAAKACGIRVLKFSLGFGPPVGIGRLRMRWVRGHTEYVVSWIPLGGFVKMLGEGTGSEEQSDVDVDPSEALSSKPLWQKLTVVFAGPVMNLLLPVLLFSVIFAVGLPQANSVIGEVEPGSPAAVAGLQPGDRITAIDGRPVKWWKRIDEALKARSDGGMTLGYSRDGVASTARVSVAPRQQIDVFGDDLTVGWIGVYHRRPLAIVGLADRSAPAYRAGLRSGDQVTAVAGKSVEDWYQFEQAYSESGVAGEVSIEFKRGDGASDAVTLSIPALGDLVSLGVVRADVLIAQVSEDTPAAHAGIRAGDLIRSVDGVPIHSFDSFAEMVRASAGRTLDLGVARDAEEIEIPVTPALVPTDLVGIGVEVPRYRIGVLGNNLLSLAGSTRVNQILNPLVSIPRATLLTIEITQVFMRGLGKLITGEVPSNQIAGPIGIAEIAGKALERGWMDYLQTLVLISINLGILNLLPIPILDGGQAVVFIIEGVRRAPLSLRTRGFVQQVGVTMLLMIMGLAFWNDISRNWSRVVDWLTEGL
jgi:regulator of sigma E protease